MGHSISNTTFKKIESLKERGLLCQDGDSHCTSRARYKLEMKSWPLKRNEATLSLKPMHFCRKHAYRMPQYGTNFEVTGIKEMG